MDLGVMSRPDYDVRFQTLFAQAPFSVQLLDANGLTVAINQAWRALWGSDALAEFVLGGGYNVLTDPQLEAKGITPYFRRAYAGESVTIPAICYDPAEIGQAGRARWVKASAHPIRDASGAVHEVMLVHEDVTAQMEAEAARREGEERLRQLANCIPQIAWMVAPEGDILWYNDRWYQYTGFTPGQHADGGWQAAIAPDALAAVVEQWAASRKDGVPYETTLPIRGQDGQYRPFLVQVAPLKDADGRIQLWFGTSTDISAIEEAERDLRAAEERLRIATEAGDIGIWEWDLKTDRLIWSDRVYSLHGVDPATYQPGRDSFGSLFNPDDFQALWTKVEKALAERSGYTHEFRVRWPDGHEHWLSTWARVETGSDGEPERLIGATISIDAHKRAEQALRENNQRKDQFLAMLAHELRNPLAPISVSAELLRMPNIDDKRVRQTSEVISRQVAHMTKLVDDLMDVSRVTRGLVQLDLQPLDLKAAIANAVEQVRPLIEQRGHVLRTRMDAGAMTVGGDRTRLVQILSNLLNNAAKYTPPGGEIGLEARIEGRRALVTVSDNGQGMEPELLPCVFDLFTQGSRALDRSQGGLGIGLALVKSIVELHGGTVEAHSAGIGLGSCFTVSLPLIPFAAAAGEGAAPSQPVTARRIVIVDDNADAAMSLALLLEADGHSVTVFDGAASALAGAPALRPDVFILDIGLPDITGYELAARLRALDETRECRLIALTGYGQEADRRQAAAAGFDHHFVKPADVRALAAVLGA